MLRLTLLLAPAFVLFGCGSGRATSIAAKSGDAAAGRTFYVAQCEVCHGADGRTGTAKKNIVNPVKSASPGAIDEILNGNGEGMPSYASQSDQTIADVVAYVKSL